MAQPVGDLVVSLDVDAAKFNEQVSYVRKQFTGLGADSTKAGTQVQQAFSKQELAAQRAGISIGQYKAAMRMLPAQFTDIATQLAGGQSPWLILLQQGGQIKDSFGGVGNVAKILLTYITPLNAAIGVAAVVFGSLGLAVYKSRQEIAEASKIIQESLGLSGSAAEKLAQNIRAIADSSGASIKSVADLFITTKDGADEATRKMIAVGFSYLDAKAKVSEYKGSSDFTNLNAQIEAHRLKVLGIPDAWTDAEEAVRNYYSGVNLGKQSVALGGAIDPIVGVLEQAKQLRGDLTKATIDGNLATQKSVEWINKEYLATDAVAGAEAKLKEAREQSRKIAFSGDATAIANAQKLIALREKEVEQAKKRQEPKKQRVTTSAGDRAEDSAQGDLLSLQAQLKVLQQHTSVNDVISQQRKDLWQAENQYAVLEQAASSRQLSAQEKSLLAHKDETLEYKRQLAALGDKVVAQQRLNALSDQADKFAQQQSAKRAALDAQAEGVSSRQADRAATLQRLQEAYAFNPSAQQRVLQEQQKTYDAEDALRSNWVAGAKQGWGEYAESATDVFTSVQQVAQSGFNGLTDQLNSLVTTGKASFKDFTSSIIKMIVNVIDRLLVAYAIQSAMGWVTGSVSGGGNAGTAITGGSYSNLQLAYNGGYIREYDAGGYTGHGGKYEPKGIVHGGEFVFTKEATSRLGVANLYRMMRGYATGGYVGGGQTPVGAAANMSAASPVFHNTIILQNEGTASAKTSGSNDEMSKAMMNMLDQFCQKNITNALRPGGQLFNAMKTR
ncbi:phage tail tape measure protein, lambda family (plasmid) [Rahnella aceris]|uniref:Phage tail tape measure protein, lambda family n=1 Tax=Rahnella sp. (strain Y9602) TaxID=2703885 RepID=A0A0H3FGZ8_RAHSY|nr:phage tail tape measure protein [Rahnella aceris]ADW76095.1 phage tail tape measure protein, lambda family [Rahnella aceris]